MWRESTMCPTCAHVIHSRHDSLVALAHKFNLHSLLTFPSYEQHTAQQFLNFMLSSCSFVKSPLLVGSIIAHSESTRELSMTGLLAILILCRIDSLALVTHSRNGNKLLTLSRVNFHSIVLVALTLVVSSNVSTSNPS